MAVYRNGQIWVRQATTAPPAEPSETQSAGYAFIQDEAAGLPTATAFKQSWFAPDTGNSYVWYDNGAGGTWLKSGVVVPIVTLGDNLEEIAAANNSSVLSQIVEVPPTRSDVEALVAERVEVRGAGVIDDVVGDVQVDLSEVGSLLIASTAGSFTLTPVNASLSRGVLYVTVYVTTNGHAMTFGRPHRWVGLLPSALSWVAGEKRTFRFTYLPNVEEWIAEELSAQFDLNASVVELADATGPAPDPDVPTPVVPFTAGVYRFDSGSFASGGVAADETSVGLGATSADAMVYLAVVDTADGNASEPTVDGVRWFVDPTVTDLSTWASTQPAIGENGFAHSSIVAPWSFTFDSRQDPTGQSNPSWDADGDHDIYAQVRFTNGLVTSVKVDLAVNNSVVTPPPAPGAPTSFAVSPLTNGLRGTWVAPTTGETGSSTITVGTAPTAMAAGYASRTITIPEDTEAGDVVLLVVNDENNPTPNPITVPSGYVQIGTRATTGTSGGQSLFYKVATGVEPSASVAVSSANIGGYAIVLKGVSPTSALDVTVQQGSNSTPAGVTTATDGALVVQCVMTNEENQLALGTANGFALQAGGEAFDTLQGNDWSAGCATKTQSTAGASGAPTWVQERGPTGQYAWHTVAFRPASTGGTTTAVGYETQLGNSAWVDVGNVLTYDWTGLTGGVAQTVRVRAYDSIGQRGSAASTSGTPDGTAPPVTIRKTVAGYSTNSNGTEVNVSAFGRNVDRDGVYIAFGPGCRRNMSKTAMPTPLALGNEIDFAYNRYLSNLRTTGFTNRANPGKPRLQVTFQLSLTGLSARKYNTKGVLINQHIPSLLDMAMTARGDRDFALVRGAEAIKANTTGGYDWVELMVMTPSHEMNGAWYASYNGVDTDLIGVSSLMNASYAEWGADVAEALRTAGETGDRGPVWALAWKRVVNAYRSVDPRFWFSLNVSTGAAAADGDGTNSAWNTDAIDSVAGYFDSIDIDGYCRGSGIPDYKGSGDINDPANWTFDLDATLADIDAMAAQYGVALGVGEAAAQFVLPGYTVAGYPTDQEASVWLRRLLTWYDSRHTHMFNYWQATSDKVAGTDYAVDPVRQPKSFAVLKEFFPAP